MGNEVSQALDQGYLGNHASTELATSSLPIHRPLRSDNGSSIPSSCDASTLHDTANKSSSEHPHEQAITVEAEKQTNEMCLTDEEKAHITEVLSRVRQLEQKEESRISKIRGELQRTEQEIRRRVSISNQDMTKTPVTCILCGRAQGLTVDGRQTPDVQWTICADCGNHVCQNCGSLVGKLTDKDAVWLCNFCQKKRKLEVSSGAWLHNLPATSKQSKKFKKYLAKRPLARTSSFTQYEEWIDRLGEDTNSDTSSQDERTKAMPKAARRFSDTHFLSNNDRGRQNLVEKIPLEEHRQRPPSEFCSSDISQKSGETPIQKDSGHVSSTDETQSPKAEHETTSLGPQQESMIKQQDESVKKEAYEKCLVEKQETVGVKEPDEVGQATKETKEGITLHKPEGEMRGSGENAVSDVSPEAIIHPDTSEVKSLFLHSKVCSPGPRISSTSNTIDESVESTWRPELSSKPIREYSTKRWSTSESFNESFNETDYPDFGDQQTAASENPLITPHIYEDSWFGIQPRTRRVSDYPQLQPIDLCPVFSEDFGEGFPDHDSLGYPCELVLKDPEPFDLPRFSQDADKQQHLPSLEQQFSKTLPEERDNLLSKTIQSTFGVPLPQQKLVGADSTPNLRPPDVPLLKQSSLGEKEISEEEKPVIEPFTPLPEDKLQTQEYYAAGQTVQDTTHIDEHMNFDFRMKLCDFQSNTRGSIVGVDSTLEVNIDRNWDGAEFRNSPDVQFQHPDENSNCLILSSSGQLVPIWPEGANPDAVFRKVNTHAEMTCPGLDTYEQWITDISQTRYSTDIESVQTTSDDRAGIPGLRRCPHFENISGLTESTTGDNEVPELPSIEETTVQQCTISSVDEETEYTAPNEERPTRVWFREKDSYIDPEPVAEKPSISMSLKQEDELWAALFNPSESLVESAKEVSAQLDRLSFGDEVNDLSNKPSSMVELHLISSGELPEQQSIVSSVGHQNLESTILAELCSPTSEIQLALVTKGASINVETSSMAVSEHFRSWFRDQPHITELNSSSATGDDEHCISEKIQPISPHWVQNSSIFPHESKLDIQPEFENDRLQPWTSMLPPTRPPDGNDSQLLATGSSITTGNYQNILNPARSDDQSTIAQTGNRNVLGSGIDRPKGARETHVIRQHTIKPSGLAKWEGRKLPRLPSSYVGGEERNDRPDLWDEQKSEEFGQDAKPVSSTSTTLADVDQSIGSCVASIGLGETSVTFTDDYCANSGKNNAEQILLESTDEARSCSSDISPPFPEHSQASDFVCNYIKLSCRELYPPCTNVLSARVEAYDAHSLLTSSPVPAASTSDETYTVSSPRKIPTSKSGTVTVTSTPTLFCEPVSVASGSSKHFFQQEGPVVESSSLQTATEASLSTVEKTPSKPGSACFKLASAQDRGLQIARKTLVSQSAYSPEDTDNFLTLWESPSASLSPRQELLQPSLFPYVTCCTSWKPCPLSSTVLSNPPESTSRNLVITTEPLHVHTVREATQYITKRTFTNTYEQVVIFERTPFLPIDKGDLFHRGNLLERIQEETVPNPEEENAISPQTTTSNVMSSSSSSRGSYLTKRRRPRSHSYTQDMLHFGEDPKVFQRTGISHRYSTNPRQIAQDYSTRRSVHDVRMGYGNSYSVRDDTDLDRYSTIGAPSGKYTTSNRMSNGRITGSLDYELNAYDDEDTYQYGTSKPVKTRGPSGISKFEQSPRSLMRYSNDREPVRFTQFPSNLEEFSTTRKGPLRNYPRPSNGYNVKLSDETEAGERRSYRSLPLTDSLSRRLQRPFEYSRFRRYTTPTLDLSYSGSLKRPSSLISGRFQAVDKTSNAMQLSKSSEHLGPNGLFRFGYGATSMQALRARLAAAHSESHLDDPLDDSQLEEYNYGNTYGSLDRRTVADSLTAQQLRRQVERQHRQLLESLLNETQWSPPLTTFELNSTARLPTQSPLPPQGTMLIPEVCQSIQHGSLISSTMAPPIFSTATVRTSTDDASGWTTATTPAPFVPINQALTLGNMDNTAQPTQLFPSNHLNLTLEPNHIFPNLGTRTGELTDATEEQPDANATLLQLLQNPDLLQAITNNPELASQLSALGLDSSLPDANQVTLAAMAGAMAATAIANAGLIDGTEFNGQPSAWSNPFQTTEYPLLAVAQQEGQGRPELMRNTDLCSVLPPYTVSNGEEVRLQNLLEQLQSTLQLDSDQTGQQVQLQPSRAMVDGFHLPQNSMNSQVGGQGFYVQPEQPVTRQQVASIQQVMGPSQTIDKWLMPGRGSVEQNHLVNGIDTEERLITPMDWPKFTSTQKQKPTPTKTEAKRTYDFPTKRILLMRDSKDRYQRENGIGMRIVGGHIRSDGRLGAFIEEIDPRGPVDQLHGEIREGDEVLEWNSIPLVDKTFEEVQAIINQVSEETELLVRARRNGPQSSTRQPWERPFLDEDVRDESKYMMQRVDALCHHHAAQQALLGMQQRPTCPHMQPPHFQSISPAEQQCVHTHTTSSGVQQLRNQYSSSTGSESAQSSERKSTGRQPISITVTEVNSPPESELYKQSSFESQRTQERALSPTFDGKGQDELQSPTSSRSITEPKKNRLSSLTERDGKEEDSSEEFGEIELILTFDDYDQSLTVHVSRARGLPPMDLNGLADPFVKVRLHPDPTEDPDFNRQTKYMPNTLTPEWQQTVVFMNCFKRTLKRRILEVTVWDFDRLKTNDFMGQTLINLGDKQLLDGRPHWYPLHKMESVILPSAKKTPPSTRTAPVDNMKSSKQTQRETIDRRNAGSKEHPKDYSASHR